jgi:hypothetical protein
MLVHVSSPKHFATRVLVHICQKEKIGLEIAGKVAKKWQLTGSDATQKYWKLGNVLEMA